MAPCNGFQDSIGGFWILCRAVDSGFQSLSVELELWVPIVSVVLESLSCIPDSRALDSRFHKKNFSDSRFQKHNFPEFRIPLAKIFQIPEFQIPLFVAKRVISQLFILVNFFITVCRY